MAECSSCVVCETTLCVTICILTSQESKDKKKRKEWKRKTKLKRLQIAVALVAQVTSSHWASSGLCSAKAPPGHCELMLCTTARCQHRSMHLPGKRLPNLEMRLLLLPGCFMACSLPGCEFDTVPTELPTGFKWTWDAGVDRSSKGPPGRNALRTGMSTSSLSSGTQIRPLAFTCCLM